MLQVSQEYDGERSVTWVVKLVVELVANRKEIQEGLRGMLTGAVSRIQNWFGGTQSNLTNAPSVRVPKDCRVRVTFKTFYGVR